MALEVNDELEQQHMDRLAMQVAWCISRGVVSAPDRKRPAVQFGSAYHDGVAVVSARSYDIQTDTYSYHFWRVEPKAVL